MTRTTAAASDKAESEGGDQTPSQYAHQKGYEHEARRNLREPEYSTFSGKKLVLL